MRLLRLNIHGFKSFKDKTTIHFDEGITGIVGPNGCGKSNIVDALFWVMGEQSAKHLRGKAMSDLIFAGSAKYSPASFAEVTLVLANDNGKHIHVNNQVIKPEEIHLTRKLFRNGETEYRINGSIARLKDIHEVFMDTGAGAKSYSIIAQGEINKLVQAKPEERRVMIEEVAGITKFKIRKKESLKKIELTQSNLNRLTDLQTEIYKNLKALEKQAEKAEKARTLKDKIKRNEMIVDSHREHDYLWDFREGSTRLNQEKEELEQLQLKRNQLEITLSDERLRKDELLSEVNDQQEEFNLLSKKLAQGEERLNYLKKSLKDKEHQIELRNKEKAEIKSDIEMASGRSSKWEEELEILKSTNPETMDLSSLEEKVDLLKEEVSSKEQEMAELRAQHDKSQRDLQQIDQQIFQNTRRLEDYVQSLQDINAEVEELEKNSSNFSDELVAQREKLATTKKSYDELKGTFESTKKSVTELEVEISGLDKESRELSKEVVKLDSRRQSLIELNESAAGIQDGTADFLRENADQGFRLLGQVLKSEPTYITAIENLMKDLFESLISENGIDQDAVKNWFADTDKGGLNLTFKAQEEFVASNSLAIIFGELTPVVEVLSFTEESYAEKFKNLFQGFYIADDLSLEKIAQLNGDQAFRGIISKDGTTIVRNNSGIITVSKISQAGESVGIVQRNNLIAELEQTWNAKRSTLEVNEKLLAQLRENYQEQKDKLADIQKEMDIAYTAYISLKSALESREGNFNAGASRLEILKNRKSDISKNRLELLEKEEVLASDKEKLSQVISAVTGEIEELTDVLLDYKSNYDQEREELMKLQLLAQSYESQVKSMERQIEDAKVQVERHEQRLNSINELVEKYCDEMELAEVETEQLAEDNKNKANELSEREESLNLYKDQLSQLLIGMQERETTVKDITQRINKLEKSLVEVELKMNKIVEDEEILVRDCFEQYRIDLRSVLSKYLEISKDSLSTLANIDSMYTMKSADGDVTVEAVAYEFNKKYPGELKEAKEKLKDYKQEINRLGEINWQAVEDYDRQKLRYEFLKVQEEELKTSLTDLQKAIEHIDEKCKIRFQEAYEAVNVRFQKVFPIIFGGGVASLQQTQGNGEDQEAGIEIIAQPPGKKMQNINLMSGGEKAMTAVSLIFSIFLVKPSPFCLLDEVDAPLDDANVGRFNELLREMSEDSQFIVITHNKKTMELNDTLYGITMQEPGVSRAVSVQLQ